MFRCVFNYNIYTACSIYMFSYDYLYIPMLEENGIFCYIEDICSLLFMCLIYGTCCKTRNKLTQSTYNIFSHIEPIFNAQNNINNFNLWLYIRLLLNSFWLHCNDLGGKVRQFRLSLVVFILGSNNQQ